MQDLKNIIESLLFVTDEPLSLDRLKNTLESTDGKEIRQALQLLHEDYEQRGGGFYLREVAGGWQLRSRPQYHEWIRRLLQPSPQRLSKAALETLAIIAYKQPIIRADIEFIRGVDCGGVLRQLMERKLIRVLGRKEIAGRPLIYATTKLFLELFDLKDLKDLPSPKEIAELTSERPSDSDQIAEDPAANPESAPESESDPEDASHPEGEPDSESEPDPESASHPGGEPQKMSGEPVEGTDAIQNQALDVRPEIPPAQGEFNGSDEVLESNPDLDEQPGKQLDGRNIQSNNA